MMFVLLSVVLEVLILRFFWFGALRRIDRIVDERMKEYAKVIVKITNDTINHP